MLRDTIHLYALFKIVRLDVRVIRDIVHQELLPFVVSIDVKLMVLWEQSQVGCTRLEFLDDLGIFYFNFHDIADAS